MDDQLPPLTRRDAVDHLRSTDAAPSADPLCVGVEQEWHTFCLTDPGRHLHPDEVLGPISAAPRLPCGSTVTVEPGGQVELATPATSPWWEALDALRVDGAAVREALAVVGIASVAAGTDPFRSTARTLGTSRYTAMEAYFDTWGPAGRRMMGGTASIQINIDHGDADTMARRWALAHRIGPALGAAFACSPSKTHRSERLAIWNEMDPTRTRSAFRSGELADDWPAYVLDARLMLVHDEHDRCRAVTVPITFGDWIEAGHEGRRPTVDDLAYHCTTLFPPVRPRGWLELRWLDALPAGLAEVATAAVVAVLTDEEAGDRSERASQDVGDAWDDAALLGPALPALGDAAVTILRAAADALDRSPAPGVLAEQVADAADRWPARGRCPADDLEDRLRRGAGAMDLADPPWVVDRWS